MQNPALKFIPVIMVAFAVFLGVAFAAAKFAGNLFPLIFIVLSLGTIVFVAWIGEKYFGAIKRKKISGWTLAKEAMDKTMEEQGELPKVKKKKSEEQ